ANLVIAEILAFPAKFLANLCVLRVLAVNFPVQSYREGAKGPSGNKVCILARAPGGQMQGAATQAMWWHRRGAATPQMPARRRAPPGLRPAGPLAVLLAPYIPQRVCSSLAPCQRAWGPAAKCTPYFLTGPKGSDPGDETSPCCGAFAFFFVRILGCGKNLQGKEGGRIPQLCRVGARREDCVCHLLRYGRSGGGRSRGTQGETKCSGGEQPAG